MEENPGLKFLKDAFNEFASKYSSDDLVARGARSFAAGAKGAVDHAMKEFPKPFVEQLSKDIYSLLTSQEMADGVSTTVRSFDEAKVTKMVDDAVTAMKDPVKSREIAKQIKDLMDKNPASDLGSQIDMLTSMIPGGGQVGPLISLFLKPILNDIKHGSVEDAAEKIQALADHIPKELIIEGVTGFTQNVTPERVSKQAHDIVGKMPSPGAVADIVHGVGEAASRNLDLATKATSLSDMPTLLKQFGQEAKTIVTDVLANDNDKKKGFDKKGQEFKF